MTNPEPPAGDTRANTTLLGLLLAVSIAFGWILLPLYTTILWSGVIAMLFTPLQRRLVRRLGGARTPAALLTLLAAICLVVLPLALVIASVAREASHVYERVQSGEWQPALYLHGVFDALPGWIVGLLGRFGLADFDTLQRLVALALVQLSQAVTTRALSIGQNAFEGVAGVFVTLYLAFFLIRDGERLVGVLRRAIPLATPHSRELVHVFNNVVRAIVKGYLLVAAVQGTLGGLAFWFLGVSGALLWGVLMALLSLLPILGAAVVWLPVALYFLVTGALWQGVALTVYGVVVVGLVDNLLRPLLVGRDTQLPDALVMIATLGGLAVFGVNGLVLGPAIAAMFIAVWQLFAALRADDEA